MTTLHEQSLYTDIADELLAKELQYQERDLNTSDKRRFPRSEWAATEEAIVSVSTGVISTLCTTLLGKILPNKYTILRERRHNHIDFQFNILHEASQTCLGPLMDPKIRTDFYYNGNFALRFEINLHDLDTPGGKLLAGRHMLEFILAYYNRLFINGINACVEASIKIAVRRGLICGLPGASTTWAEYCTRIKQTMFSMNTYWSDGFQAWADEAIGYLGGNKPLILLIPPNSFHIAAKLHPRKIDDTQYRIHTLKKDGAIVDAKPKKGDVAVGQFGYCKMFEVQHIATGNTGVKPPRFLLEQNIKINKMIRINLMAFYVYCGSHICDYDIFDDNVVAPKVIKYKSSQMNAGIYCDDRSGYVTITPTDAIDHILAFGENGDISQDFKNFVANKPAEARGHPFVNNDANDTHVHVTICDVINGMKNKAAKKKLIDYAINNETNKGLYGVRFVQNELINDGNGKALNKANLLALVNNNLPIPFDYKLTRNCIGIVGHDNMMIDPQDLGYTYIGPESLTIGVENHTEIASYNVELGADIHNPQQIVRMENAYYIALLGGLSSKFCNNAHDYAERCSQETPYNELNIGDIGVELFHTNAKIEKTFMPIQVARGPKPSTSDVLEDTNNEIVYYSPDHEFILYLQENTGNEYQSSSNKINTCEMQWEMAHNKTVRHKPDQTTHTSGNSPYINFETISRI